MNYAIYVAGAPCKDYDGISEAVEAAEQAARANNRGVLLYQYTIDLGGHRKVTIATYDPSKGWRGAQGEPGPRKLSRRELAEIAELAALGLRIPVIEGYSA